MNKQMIEMYDIPINYDPEVAYHIENLHKGEEGNIEAGVYYLEVYCKRPSFPVEPTTSR